VRRAARLLAAAAAAVVATAGEAAPRLDPIFSDHAVLQRERPITVWGRADPGERVRVSLGAARRAAKADRAGRWQVAFPAMKAGGPYRLAVAGRSGAGSAADDLLVGDVWLCSGQSNMEFPVARALNGDAEAASANDPEVRLLHVPQRTSVTAEPALPGDTAWRALTPATARDFPAACWFMVRELRRHEKVPFGMIGASWGGTRIRPWMDEAAARAAGGAEDAELLALYRRDPAAAGRRFGEIWGRWWRSVSGDAEGTEPWRNANRLEWRPFPSISIWEGWGDPAFAEFNGHVWARKRFTLTADEAAAGGTLSLGVIDDLDMTFVNGVGVGSQFGWSNPREYRLAPGVLRAGENEVLVNIGDSWGAGGFQGGAERLSLTLSGGAARPLGEGWDYSVVPARYGSGPRAPWDSHAGLSTIYNAMIAPLGRYGLTGVAWYQGESDVGVPDYDARLAAMMASWRRQFAAPKLPFLIVGLANFGAPNAVPQASGWAALRDEQRQAAARDAHAALVVAMDLGERADIHPPNKQEVGRRLAQAARALVYGERGLAASGPEVARATRAAGSIVVDFTGVTGRLTTYSGARATAFELCGETQQSCRWADATAAGSRVVLADDGKPATRVRYAWGEGAVVNLYDEAGLPAGPFEVGIE
jgi:sialate O-acetylesterase